MEINCFDTLSSTQIYIIEKLNVSEYKAPVAVLAYEQSAGIGSRNNQWSGGRGNFFTSIAIDIDALPKDLPLASASIYFSYIMKKTLKNLGHNIWLKWPNDFYVDSDKIGGTITKKIKNTLVCGIGINLKNSQNLYRALHGNISAYSLLSKYLEELEKFPTWKQIFSEYSVEFELSRRFSVHIENKKESLSDATLCSDGSLNIRGKQVYSLR